MNWYKTSANINSLTSLFQQEMTNKSFKDLTEQERNNLIEYINKRKEEIKKQVEHITSNPQYQSWIYDLLLSKKLTFPEDVDKTKSLLINYHKVKLSSNFPKEYKDITQFKSFGDLHKIVGEYSKEFSKGKKVIDLGDNEVIYDKDGIQIVELLDYNECSYLLKDTGWCVQNKSYFDEYDPPFYLFIRDGKKYALAHLGSSQFKDIHDDPIQNIDIKIFRAINVLYSNENLTVFKGDFGCLVNFIGNNLNNKEILDFLKQNINKLSNDNVSSLLRSAPNTQEMANIILEYKGNNLSDNNISNLLRSAPNTQEMANIILEYKGNNLSDDNVSSLLISAPNKQEMVDIILEYKGNNFSGSNVYVLLSFAPNKQEMANILGKEKINKLSDHNVYYLLLSAPNKQEMAKIILEYAPKFSDYIRNKFSNLTIPNQALVTASRLWSTKFNDNYIGKL